MSLTNDNSLQSFFHSESMSLQRRKPKYIVIDSQNEQDCGRIKVWDSFQPYRSTSQGSKLRQKIRHSDVDCFGVRKILKEDEEVRIAEKKVKDLQRQCEMLEKMINQLIIEEAELKVQERKRQRSKSLKQEHKIFKPCLIHSRQESLKRKKDLDQIINFQLSNISVLEENLRPLHSNQLKERTAIQNSAAQIRYRPKAKERFDRQNQTPLGGKRQKSHLSKSKSKNQNCIHSKVGSSKFNRL